MQTAAASGGRELEGRGQGVGLPEAGLRQVRVDGTRAAAPVAAAPAPVARCRRSTALEPPPWARPGIVAAAAASDGERGDGVGQRAAGGARRGRRRARGRDRRAAAAPAGARRSRRQTVIRAAPPTPDEADRVGAGDAEQQVRQRRRARRPRREGHDDAPAGDRAASRDRLGGGVPGGRGSALAPPRPRRSGRRAGRRRPRARARRRRARRTRAAARRDGRAPATTRHTGRGTHPRS